MVGLKNKAHYLEESRLSFPSGHASMSAAGWCASMGSWEIGHTPGIKLSLFLGFAGSTVGDPMSICPLTVLLPVNYAETSLFLECS